jgi:hypothetical protein
VREGRLPELYDLNAVESFEMEMVKQQGLELGPGFGPWWNPPFAAWAFVPLAGMPYAIAVRVWMGISLLALVAAIVLMCRMLIVARVSNPCERRDDLTDPGFPQALSATCTGWKPVPRGTDWHTWGLIPLLVLISTPFIQAVSHGLNTLISLMLLSIVVTLWRAERALLAGFVCGLMFYKPQLSAIVAGILALDLGRRACLGVGISGVCLLLLTVLTMPGALQDWLTRMPENLRWFQEQQHYAWERHATFKGFWRLLVQGHELGPSEQIVTMLSVLCMLGVGIGLLMTAIRVHRTRREQTDAADGRDRLIAATFASMPLLMPFYFDYDLLLLAIPATLFGAQMWRDGFRTRVDHAILWAWAILFLSMIVNPVVGKHAHVNLNVPVLCVLSVLLIRRAWDVRVGHELTRMNTNEDRIEVTPDSCQFV